MAQDLESQQWHFHTSLLPDSQMYDICTRVEQYHRCKCLITHIQYINQEMWPGSQRINFLRKITTLMNEQPELREEQSKFIREFADAQDIKVNAWLDTVNSAFYQHMADAAEDFWENQFKKLLNASN